MDCVVNSSDATGAPNANHSLPQCQRTKKEHGKKKVDKILPMDAGAPRLPMCGRGTSAVVSNGRVAADPTNPMQKSWQLNLNMFTPDN